MSDDLFNFDSFMADVQRQEELRANRQAEALKAVRTQGAIKEKSAAAAQQYNKSVDFMRQNLAVSQQKMQHARQLADSKNPLDTLRLVGLQSMDPMGYTRKGRQARLAEDMQMASALGQMHGINQAALEAQLVASTTKLNEAEILEAIGMEKLKSIQDYAATAKGNLEASMTLKSAAIHQLDLSAVDAAIQQASNSENGSVNVGGIDIDLRTLQDRGEALREREHQMRLKNALRVVELSEAEDKAQNVQHDQNVRDFNRTLEQDTIANADTTLLLRQAERDKSLRTVKQEIQQRELATMDSEELLAIRTNRYRTESGEQYVPDDVDKAYTQKIQARSDYVTEQLNRQSLMQFDTETLAAEKNRLDLLKTRFRTNSPVAIAAQHYESALGIASTVAGPENNISNRMVGYAAYMASRKQFEEAVAKQAKFESKGDKAREEMLTEFYRGNPIPTETLMNSVQDRLTKNKSLADILPPQIAVQVERKYRDLFQQQMQYNPMSMQGRQTAEDRKLIQAEAAQQAVDWAIEQQIQGKADLIFSQQVTAPTHPLHGNGRATPGQMFTILKSADEKAKQKTMEAYGLDEMQFGVLMRGGVPDRIKPEDAATMRILHSGNEDTFFLMELEALEPGLGTKVARWWQTDGAAYVDSISQASSNPTDFGQAVVDGLTNSKLKDSMASYAANLYSRDEFVRQEHARRFSDFITFGSNPESAQVMMLNAVKDLESSEKKQLWKNVFVPLLAETQRQGLDFKKANEFIEAQLMSGEIETDSGTKALLKTLRRTRPDVIRNISNMQGWGKWFFGDRFQGTPAPSAIDWYEGDLSRPNPDQFLTPKDVFGGR